MPFGEDNGGDRASDLDVDSDDLSSDEDEEDIMMQPALTAKKRKKVKPTAKAQRKVEDDRKPPAVAVVPAAKAQRKVGDDRKPPAAEAKKRKKVQPAAKAQRKVEDDRKPAAAAVARKPGRNSEKKREASRKQIVINSQNSGLVKKLKVMQEENATQVRMLALMIDNPEIEIVSWVEMEDTSGQKHWCVFCCDANGILTWMETFRKKKYAMKSGLTKESFFKENFLKVNGYNFHPVEESEPEVGQWQTAVGDDWYLIMHHPDFTQGNDGKVDWKALKNVVGGKNRKKGSKNPVRDEIDWDIDDDLKTKRTRKTYVLSYRLDDNLDWRAPGNKISVSLGSYYNDSGSDESQRGIQNQNLAMDLVEKRRKSGQCIKLETMIEVLEKMGYRLAAKAAKK